MLTFVCSLLFRLCRLMINSTVFHQTIYLLVKKSFCKFDKLYFCAYLFYQHFSNSYFELNETKKNSISMTITSIKITEYVLDRIECLSDVINTVTLFSQRFILLKKLNRSIMFCNVIQQLQNEMHEPYFSCSLPQYLNTIHYQQMLFSESAKSCFYDTNIVFQCQFYISNAKKFKVYPLLSKYIQK